MKRKENNEIFKMKMEKQTDRMHLMQVKRDTMRREW